MSLVMHRSSEPEETDCSENDDNEDQHESELRFIDALIPLREAQADPIVQRAGNNFTKNGEYEGREGDQTGLGDGEIIWRRDEDDTVNDAEDDDPCQCRTVDKESPENGWVEEEHHGACVDLPDRSVRVPACEDP